NRPGPTVITISHNVSGPPDLRFLGVINGIPDLRSLTELGTPDSLLHLRTSKQEGQQCRKGERGAGCSLSSSLLPRYS
ncbi:hypothetical protein V3C99_004824, partial [Haemonchus contortus]